MMIFIYFSSLSANKQSYIAIGVLVYLYTSDFKIE